MVYDVKLDEANNRIYILPWNASQLLVYDLQGNVLDPIPLCLRCPKAKFNVDLTGGKVSIVLLPFKGSAAVGLDTGFERKQARLHGTGTFGSTSGLQ